MLLAGKLLFGDHHGFLARSSLRLNGHLFMTTASYRGGDLVRPWKGYLFEWSLVHVDYTHELLFQQSGPAFAAGLVACNQLCNFFAVGSPHRCKFRKVDRSLTDERRSFRHVVANLHRYVKLRGRAIEKRVFLEGSNSGCGLAPREDESQHSHEIVRQVHLEGLDSGQVCLCGLVKVDPKE